MATDSALRMFGWLIFAWGAGIMAIAAFSSTARVRSPIRRIADALSGLFFCLLAATLIVGEVATTARLSVPAALIAGAASYFLGRHARRMDREYRAQRRRKVDEG